jgi:hypothetical protein
MPGPAPSHRPQFPEAFLEQARAILRRRTAPYCHTQRARLALLLEESPHLGHAQAGGAVGLSAPQVRRWRQRWAAGNFALDDLPGGGRKAHFSPPGQGGRQGHRL